MRDSAERGLLARVVGAAALRSAVFGEVAEDRGALAQAVVVVLLASLAASTQDYGLGWGAMAWVAAVSVLQWLFWVLVSYEVGCDLLGGEATLAALLRTLGFARAPGILMALGPVVGGIHFLAHAWTFLAGVVAIREACAFGMVRAVITAMCGIVPYWALNFLVLN